MDKCWALDLEVVGSNHGWGDFFSLKFLLLRKWTKWRTRRRTTKVIPWSLADGRSQKLLFILGHRSWAEKDELCSAASFLNTKVSPKTIFDRRTLSWRSNGRDEAHQSFAAARVSKASFVPLLPLPAYFWNTFNGEFGQPTFFCLLCYFQLKL